MGLLRGMRAQPEVPRNDVMGTGSSVIWDGKPLTSWKKGIAGSGNRKSGVLGWETADQWGKGIVGSGNRKSRDLGWKTADS